MIKARNGRFLAAAALMVLAMVAAGCGDGSDSDAAVTSEDQPTIVVTTNILGDVVDELVGDQANVVTIMPVGADPHDFQPSAQEVDQLLQADALIVNGNDFEEGLIDVIGSADTEGVPIFEATSAVETIEFGEGGHGDEHDDEDKEHSDEDEHDDEHDDEHSDEDEHEDDDHGHDGDDPHFFTDPNRMADAVRGIETFLAAEIEGLDADDLSTATDAYVSELEALDAEVEALVAEIPEAGRVLVTNHEVFGYFADRYGFEVVGTVIPAGSTTDGTSAGDLAELAETIQAEGVRAIFGDTSSSSELVDTLADEVGGDISIVELYSESLGEEGSDGGTYLDMIRTNAERISEALA